MPKGRYHRALCYAARYDFIFILSTRHARNSKFVAENKPGLDLAQKVKTPSGEEILAEIGFGVEFFRPFYGL